jgi:ferredoxin
MAHFITDLCVGCTMCYKECPTDAIAGANKVLHVINESLCIDCGICANVCPVKAIVNPEGIAVDKKKIRKERPKVTVDQENCTGCVACVDFCPYGALEMVPVGDDYTGHLSSEVAHVIEDKCVGCGICTEACIKEVIFFRPEEVIEYESNLIGSSI